jgi:hypothetical protein
VHYGPDGAEAARHNWHPFERNQLFLDELCHFLAACRGKKQPSVRQSGRQPSNCAGGPPVD